MTISHDPYADMFHFPMGACVRWVESPAERHYVGQRRWTEREILDPLVEYRIRLGQKKGWYLAWVNEHDLMAWQEE